jgi:hypothetical protein
LTFLSPRNQSSTGPIQALAPFKVQATKIEGGYRKAFNRVGTINNLFVMKKFKMIKAFESSKLTKEQMTQTTGGMMIRCTGGTRSICHIDGTDDGDDVYYFGY